MYETKNELIEALYASGLSCNDIFHEAEKCRLRTAEKTYEWFFKVMLHKPGQGDTSLIRWFENVIDDMGLEDHAEQIYRLRDDWEKVFENQADWVNEDSAYKPDSLALLNNQFIREWRREHNKRYKALQIRARVHDRLLDKVAPSIDRESYHTLSDFLCKRRMTKVDEYDKKIDEISYKYGDLMEPFWLQLIADVYKAAPSWEEFSEALEKYEAEMAEEYEDD
jgi:hypothetical protein